MVECFKIQLLQLPLESNVLDLEKGKNILSIPCLKPFFKLNPTIIEADPFLFVHNEKLYLFYESKPWHSPGVIKMINSKDLVNWSKPLVVLQEPFHLSFPWVFEDGGKIYMIPETSGDNSVRLYEALKNDLSEFKFSKKLITDEYPERWKTSYCDTAIIKKDGIYYLLTTRRNKTGVNTLELYMSEELNGEYKVHPKSPLYADNKTGRNAGSIMHINGELFRYSQDCTRRYGDNVHVIRINTLTPSEYSEEVLKEQIIPTSMDYYKDGGHQYNAVRFKNHWIVATDAKEYHKLSFHRIINKLWRQVDCKY